MTSEDETIADIIAEMRRREKSHYYPKVARNIMHQYADRIETAAKRQEQCHLDQIRDAVNMIGHERFVKEHPPIGNAAAMREALVKCREIALQWQADEADGVAGTTDKPSARSAAEAVIDMEFEINAALAAPPRQCDIGTAEEQSDRFANLCDSHSGCSQCPVKSLWNFANGHKPSCGVLWAQMPYEAKEGGAK